MDHDVHISAIGLNHRSAPVSVREQCSLSEDCTRRFLKSARETVGQALVLDTCNRTEFYCASHGSDNAVGTILEQVRAVDGPDLSGYSEHFYRHTGDEAVSHLFRVAASLDSQVLGEDEILGQLKEAYTLAHRLGATGPELNELLHRAFRLGKRVRNETLLSRGSFNVSRAAVGLAGRLIDSPSDSQAVVVGAGESAEQAAFALMQDGFDRTAVANRSVEPACRLIRQVAAHAGPRSDTASATPQGAGGEPDAGCPLPDCPRHFADQQEVPDCGVMELGRLPEVLPAFDLLICSTGAPEPVLKADDLVVPQGASRPLVILDIAVPRDVEPGIADAPGVHLYNVDDLDGLIEECGDDRRSEVPAAAKIVEEEVDKFFRWLEGRRVAPTIKLLKEHLEELAREEVERYAGDFHPSDREELEKFARSLSRKFLHRPASGLKEMASGSTNGEHRKAEQVLRRLFELEK